VGPNSATGNAGVNMYTVIAVGTGNGGTPTPTPTPTPTNTPPAGPVQLSNLTVADAANAAKWSLQTNLQVGNVQYGDRGYTISTVPGGLVGAAWIRSAMGSKAFARNPLVTFTIHPPAPVYAALDTRAAKPAWIEVSETNIRL